MNSSPYPDFSDTEITPQMQQAAKRSTWVSVVVNTILSALQIAIGFFAQSQALIADGIHSLSDLLSDFVVLIAGRYSEKEADEGHPYGHRRYENAASLVLGVLLLSVAVGMIFRAVEKFAEPDAIAQVHSIALWVALLTLLMKEALFRYMLAAAKRVRSGMLAANAWHARSDAASSLVVALGIGGSLAGYRFLEPLAAALVGFMIGLTPLEVGPGDRVQIVRAISTYTRDPQGVDDVALLDITTIRTLDYVRKACRERISLRFPREKLSERTPDKVRSELLDVLYKLEELEIVEAVDANKAGLIVERDSQDVNRLDAKIPVDVVNGLHVFAGRIDLLL